ncbi:Tn3 family transposase [Legionella longbeachae]|nr:conserved hypothetical protein [Legionella longbeachae D-4968]QED10770.1 Tn3 family transposase [Legionella longbeachae]QIN32350.1 Tn3 family transposase [Legionella longbeachae]QIN35696.1 Tn3 family transposase [Legionella longbeachae]RZV25198.1 hypothetical protein EKG34_09130 [Legionella longbeachae]
MGNPRRVRLALSLVSNAVLYWNTMKMTGIISQLKNNVGLLQGVCKRL